MTMSQQAIDELYCYTLAHGDAKFIHQHVVDAFGAQSEQPGDKPIRYVFSLAGLFLHIEKGFTGREVQLAHGIMAQKKRLWPSLVIPADRGFITAGTVVSAPVEERDAMIHAWCRSVWEACSMNREAIRELLDGLGISSPANVSRSVHGQRRRVGKSRSSTSPSALDRAIDHGRSRWES